MIRSRINNVVDGVISPEDQVADLEQALSIAGFGWYNIKYCLLQTLFLLGAIIEIVGYSYIMPSARCDLNMSDSLRGFISSVPYIGIILTAFAWGYVVDTMGRKQAVIYSSLACGTFGLAAAFMPDLISFTIFKFLAALCIACPASTPYTIIGEILPLKYRDIMLSITNAEQMMGAALMPLIAWGILGLDFRIDFGLYYFRSWRLLSIVFSFIFIISASLMSFGPESPKYLMSQGKHDEALEVLKNIYAGNKKKPKSEFPIKKLKSYDNNIREKSKFLDSLKLQSQQLLKPPYLKWLALEGFLLFGLYSALNGLFMWVPDVLNRVFTGDSNPGMTACEVISQGMAETEGEMECNDNLDRMSFIITASASTINAILAFILSSTLRFIGKKTLTVFMFFLVGTFCFLTIIVTDQILFAVFLCGLQLGAVCIGPINAFAIEIFPTKLRGMAISLIIMIGRVGSVIGTNITGVLLNNSCPTTFYLFGGLLLLCGLATFLLPKSKSSTSNKQNGVTNTEVGDQNTDVNKNGYRPNENTHL